ncbi:MAG: ABC transporter substrate-binding protein [Candidatus Cloacimonetes bacterium]|nr:ABC transporter substrate-binding protein [Candidatus Cloacimonadota bacterium]
MKAILLFMVTGTAFALGFEITSLDTHKEINIQDEKFCLYPRDKGSDTCPLDTKKVPVPVRRFITLSSTHLASIERLQLESRLVGVSQMKHFDSQVLQSRFRKKMLHEVGMDYNLNVEKVIELQPEIVFYYAPVQDAPNLVKLKKMGIVMVPVNDYLEKHPLDVLEWLELVAAFFDREIEARKIIATIKQKYSDAASLIKNVKKRPRVMVNSAYSGSWFVPGAQSFLAQWIKDAGGDYLFSDLSGRGGHNIGLEEALNRGMHADIWLITADVKSRQDLIDQDKRHGLLMPFQTNMVFNSLGIRNKNETTDWFERSMANPDLVLMDLISVFHKEVVPDYKRRWYDRLY